MTGKGRKLLVPWNKASWHLLREQGIAIIRKWDWERGNRERKTVI